MKLAEVLTELNQPEAMEVLRPHWEESEATFPAGRPSFLDPEEIRSSREWCGLGPEVDAGQAMAAGLEETVRRITANPALLHLAWHGHRLLWHEPSYNRFRDWPDLEPALSELSGAFYLLLSLTAAPRIRAVHKSRGVPESVTRDTCLDIRIGADRYRSISSGRLGMERRLLSWHRLVGSGDLHRLGRMQYVVRPFRGQLRVYRQRSTNRVLALSADGIRFNSEGFVDGAGGIVDKRGGWTARLVEADNKVTGAALSPCGMAEPRPVTLRLDEWDGVLAEGDPVLEMHIPEGGAMTPESCRSSMQRALEFFPAHYPDRHFRAFACYSWLFNTQLEEMLRPSSNLLQYQRELYLFPRPSSGRDGLYFIFYQDDVDLKTAPRDTALKRAILAHLEAGKPLRNGGMFMLKEDLQHFGAQHYRSNWPGEEE